MSSCGIAVKALRIQRKQREWERLHRLLEARAERARDVAELLASLQARMRGASSAVERAEIQFEIDQFRKEIGAGEETGLLARDFKTAGMRAVTVYKFDKAVLDALNELEESVARELGQLQAVPEKAAEADALATLRGFLG